MKTQLKIVSYYRVSTVRQGESGLGLEAQANAVEQYRKANSCVEIASYQEVESGKNSERPELAKAISHCRMARAVLVVAKLDRLARNVAFLSALMDSSVEFVACDNPNANRLTIHILAAVAEDEAVRISSRTRAALQVVKSHGKDLGSARVGHWEGLTKNEKHLRNDRRLFGAEKARKASIKVRSASAQKAKADLLPIVTSLKQQNLSLVQIADELNKLGFLTRQAKPWNQFSVCRLLKGSN